jgi:hypothetical protein
MAPLGSVGMTIRGELAFGRGLIGSRANDKIVIVRGAHYANPVPVPGQGFAILNIN